MGISVVICTHTMERWDSLAGAVQSTLDQSQAPDEVVVVVDHNDELLGRATRELKDVVVVANRSAKGLSGARNTGVVTSTGDVVAFIDDDATAERDWLEQLSAPLENPSVAGVGGWILPNWEAPPPSWFPETYYWIFGCSYSGLPVSGARVRNPIGTNMALRRQVFTSVGGFNSAIGRIGSVPLGCEETELCIRYARRFPDDQFILVREAIVHHSVPASRLTWHYFWRRCWAEGLSKAVVSSLNHPESGLSAERSYLEHALPRELGRTLRLFPHHPRSALARSAFMFAGTVFAGAGLIKGKVTLRRATQDSLGGDLSSLQIPEGRDALWRPTLRGPE